MTYSKSMADLLAEKLAPVVRKLADNTARLVGTQVSMLRISQDIDPFTRKKRDVLGDLAPRTWGSTVLANIMVKYPFQKLDIFPERIDGQKRWVAGGYDLAEILPIELELPFEGIPEEDAVDIADGDYLVDVLIDADGDFIPLIMKLGQVSAGFMVKHMVRKTSNMTLVRGTIEPQVRVQIDKYLADIAEGRV
jgi:hypothetical protein